MDPKVRMGVLAAVLVLCLTALPVAFIGIYLAGQESATPDKPGGKGKAGNTDKGPQARLPEPRRPEPRRPEPERARPIPPVLPPAIKPDVPTVKPDDPPPPDVGRPEIRIPPISDKPKPPGKPGKPVDPPPIEEKPDVVPPVEPLETGKRPDPLPVPDVPVPGRLLKELVVGYETREINGFRFLLSTQVIREAKGMQGRPFKALVTEFDGLVRVLQPNALKVLRKVPIWVEWDNRGSAGHVIAKFSAGLNWAENPLKNNSIEVVSLKSLTREKEAFGDKDHLVLLHEMAHAVHFLIFGANNNNVAFAYNQAMERRLYDNVQTAAGGFARAYAATNEYEYFAELSCAYLDRCVYYPFTREDLQEHDPTGYRLMELAWRGAGRNKPAEPAGPKEKAK